jgi:predicted Fe-Mo cluster-binding NifX family protein
VIFTKICIPTLEKNGLNSNISLHFGKTPYFAFLKEKNGEIEDIIFSESGGKHNGGSLTPAEIILDFDANILICGNLGSKAVNMLQQNNVKVFSGASGTVQEVFEQWMHGKLFTADENSCSKMDN